MIDAQVDEILEKRKALVARSGATCAWGNIPLRLRQGDEIGARGWTTREIDEVKLRDLLDGTTDAKMAAMRMYWAVRWDQEDAAKVRKEAHDQETRQELENFQRWAKYGPPGVYADLDDDSFEINDEHQRDAFDKVVAFPFKPNEPDPFAPGAVRFQSLAMLGTPGTGKTHLASIWLRERMLVDGVEGQFITAAQLVREVRRAWNERGLDETEILQRFGTLEALVVDDLGVDTSESAVRLLVEVLDMRLAHGLATCFTSNATLEELEEIFGPRGFSRLMAQAQVVAMVGDDYRLASLA